MVIGTLQIFAQVKYSKNYYKDGDVAMLIRIEYTDSNSRDNIISQNADKILVEEQNITEGNFLIFSDIPLNEKVVYKDVSESEFEQLKLENEATKQALAELTVYISMMNGGI